MSEIKSNEECESTDIDKINYLKSINEIIKNFGKNELSIEDLNIEFFKINVLSVILDAIRFLKTANFQNIPILLRLMVDYFGDEVIELVAKKILPEIIQSVNECNVYKRNDCISLFIAIIQTISEEKREYICIDFLNELSISDNTTEHIIGVYIFPLVKDVSKVEDIFRTFLLDKDPHVRIAIVDVLKVCKFRPQLFSYVIGCLAHDLNVMVQKKVAIMFLEIAQDFIKPYKYLLKSPSTGDIAIDSLPAMIKIHGFEKFKKVFVKIISMFPDKCADVLVKISPDYGHKDPEGLLTLAKLLIKNISFMWKLYEFSTSFDNKEPFYELLSPIKAKNWRLRYAIQHQIIKFVDIFGSRFTDYNTRFSGDLVATIRDFSSRIWVELILRDDSVMDKIIWLSQLGWKQRLIVAKVISNDRVREKFTDLMEKIANDPVSNVQFCLARGLYGSEYYDKYFTNYDTQEMKYYIEFNNQVCYEL